MMVERKYIDDGVTEPKTNSEEVREAIRVVLDRLPMTARGVGEVQRAMVALERAHYNKNWVMYIP